jgi:hypothetical protein
LSGLVFGVLMSGLRHVRNPITGGGFGRIRASASRRNIWDIHTSRQSASAALQSKETMAAASVLRACFSRPSRYWAMATIRHGAGPMTLDASPSMMEIALASRPWHSWGRAVKPSRSSRSPHPTPSGVSGRRLRRCRLLPLPAGLLGGHVARRSHGGAALGKPCSAFQVPGLVHDSHAVSA